MYFFNILLFYILLIHSLYLFVKKDEIQELQRQLQSLGDAQGRFINAKSSLKDMCDNPDEKEI